MTSSRREIILEGIGNCKSATNKAIHARDSTTDPVLRELAEAIRFLSFGAQQIGHGLADHGRYDDLPRG
ncbi:hypothetical protein ACTXI9_01745 [Brachybacterium alimentarium]|uniref:hypothetical protein n=1 Tax=Brachybacterium alimentarium TaxID=47845 RepID=UPI003FCFCA8E